MLIFTNGCPLKDEVCWLTENSHVFTSTSLLIKIINNQWSRPLQQLLYLFSSTVPPARLSLFLGWFTMNRLRTTSVIVAVGDNLILDQQMLMHQSAAISSIRKITLLTEEMPIYMRVWPRHSSSQMCVYCFISSCDCETKLTLTWTLFSLGEKRETEDESVTLSSPFLSSITPLVSFHHPCTCSVTHSLLTYFPNALAQHKICFLSGHMTIRPTDRHATTS